MNQCSRSTTTIVVTSKINRAVSQSAPCTILTHCKILTPQAQIRATLPWYRHLSKPKQSRASPRKFTTSPNSKLTELREKKRYFKLAQLRELYNKKGMWGCQSVKAIGRATRGEAHVGTLEKWEGDSTVKRGDGRVEVDWTSSREVPVCLSLANCVILYGLLRLEREVANVERRFWLVQTCEVMTTTTTTATEGNVSVARVGIAPRPRSTPALWTVNGSIMPGRAL